MGRRDLLFQKKAVAGVDNRGTCSRWLEGTKAGPADPPEPGPLSVLCSLHTMTNHNVDLLLGQQPSDPSLHACLTGKTTEPGGGSGPSQSLCDPL